MTLQRPPSLVSAGSRLSLYSTTSSVRTSRGVSRNTGQRGGRSISSPGWWGRPLVRTAWYTDLATGAWHAAWFSIFLACWTFVMSVFDVYCLEEATPGSIHTGYYWISYEFVYVGNHHIRNLLVLASLLSIAASVALFVTTCLLLNALRLENQTGFSAYLATMTTFTAWRLAHVGYSTIVNDLIFGYHIFTFFTGLMLTAGSVAALVVVYSLCQELRQLTQLEDLTRAKLDLTSRAGSVYGAGSLYGQSRASNFGTLQSRGSNFGTLQSGASGLYTAAPAYSGDTSSLYTSTPRQQTEHLYDTLQRPDTAIYSTIIN